MPSHGRGEATVCCGVKRRPDIREVEVEVIAGAAEGNGLSDAAVPREPAPAVSAHSLDPSTPNHDVRAMIDERRLEERPPWPAPVPVRETNLATGAASETLCEIKFWRGYFSGAFYARLASDSDPLAAVARSPYFRHRGADVPQRAGPALSAYEALLEELQRAGWEHGRPGNVWFADVLVRRA